jgi:hypothetical protein
MSLPIILTFEVIAMSSSLYNIFILSNLATLVHDLILSLVLLIRKILKKLSVTLLSEILISF